MAALDDLIDQISDVTLRERIRDEVKRANKQKKFGLVYEEHIPEATPLYDVPVKVGSLVTEKGGRISDLYYVRSIADGNAVCVHKVTHEEKAFPLNAVVSVAEFGDPIYPYLQKIDAVCNAPDSDLWHTLIEADNYHALQLLEYLYAGKVDCIYIDPPYNTGARDWKYNNDYVDGTDSYRHSKWLSFMEKRLRLAKKLLNPKDSVLIVTIDEKEYLHLGCLLEEMFPEARIQMISSCINPAGSSRDKQFMRSDEYIFFVGIGLASPVPLELSEEWMAGIKSSTKGGVHWNSLMRTGTSARRQDRPNMFYPIYISPETKKIVKVGDGLRLEQDRNSVEKLENAITAFPIRTDGSEGRWRVGADTLRQLYADHFVKIGRITESGAAISYLAEGEQAKIKEGIYEILGVSEDNSYIINDESYNARFIPMTQWLISSHDASRNGTNLLTNVIGEKRFSFPKSLYAVHDAVRFFVAKKPNALIVDFFAGSGTTLHAVNLLNAEDGGHRRCIMVTNNEVSADEAKSLSAQGYQPGDPEWEKLGIARYVTWPRTVCSIEGHDVIGNPLKGNYLGGDPENPRAMSDGFAANAIYFKLGFLDKNEVELGRQFKEMLPLLWMKAGAHGPCPSIEDEIPGMLILPENRMAVLIQERFYMDFLEVLEKQPEIRTVFIVTDSETGYRDMIDPLKDRETYQLYRDYLDNFRINSVRR